MMVAAWEPSPAAAKPKPQAIPPECFRTAAIGRATAGPVTMRTAKLLPDFTFAITGDVPLPENPTPLVAVQFTNTSPAALTAKSKLEWDFGDGQTSETASPTHVYLHPGLYTVKLTIARSAKPLEMVHRIYVNRPFVTGRDAAKAPKLDDFLPILATYNPKKLDAVGLKQLVAAYQWKIDTLITPSPQEAKAGGSRLESSAEEKDSHAVREQAAARKAEIRKYLELAVMAGRRRSSKTRRPKAMNLYQLAQLPARWPAIAWSIRSGRPHLGGSRRKDWPVSMEGRMRNRGCRHRDQ